MTKPKVACVGSGVVGTAMYNLCGPETVMYDILDKPGYTQDKGKVNKCDVAFINVPTPMADDKTCDTSVVEEVVSWITCPLIIIRSTVSPGTTDRLSQKYGRNIVFQPEYLGETPGHIFGNMAEREFIVLGGEPQYTSLAADFYKNYYNATVHIYFCDAVTAEVCKYMENAFYAMKVTFVNEFYDIAQAHGIRFNQLREIWLADTRISRDHTFVIPDARGFSGKCLPKDCNAIVQSALKFGCVPKLMQACLDINDEFQALNMYNDE